MRKQAINGKVALIADGGHPLGGIISQVLSETGVHVVVAHSGDENIAGIQRSLSPHDTWIDHITLSSGNEQETIDAVSYAVMQYGRLDVLINNVSIDIINPIESMSSNDWERVLRANLQGPFLTSKYALPYMKQQGSGHIFNIVSTANCKTWANSAAYHVSRWGLLGFTHSLNAEAAPCNVKVMAMVSGGMNAAVENKKPGGINLTTVEDYTSMAHIIKFILSQPDDTILPEVVIPPLEPALAM